MGLRINTNVVALASQHKLQATSKRLTTALERLSSGLRINKGSDDVVGLLKSESLRSQIRGIGAAQLNVSNASNLLGVGEGSLAQLTDVAQRMRELLVQAADSTISSSDRSNLTTSVNDLLNEYGRLAQSSEFDGVKLLDGTFSAKTFQIGPQSGNTLAITIADTRASAVGKVAIFTAITLSARGSGAGTALSLTDFSNLVINAVTLSSAAFTADGVSTADSDESAIAYVNAINSVAGQSGVLAQVLANVITFSLVSAVDLTAGDRITINGVTLTAQDVSHTDSTGVNSFVNSINNISTSSGVTASYEVSSSIIVLTAGDGRNIALAMNLTASSSSSVLSLGMAGSGNAGVVYRGTFRLFADKAFTTVNASSVIGAAANSVALADTTTLTNVNLETSSNATTGIFILDNVIRQLQNRRSDVGSKSIRLEVAASELQTRKENLSASESRIRDADIAAETADLTAAQILQQAGVTVLARANAIPQIALTLLQA